LQPKDVGIDVAIEQLQPKGWAEPKGYSNGFKCTGSEWIVIGGQIGWNGQCQFETDDFVGQVRQALVNIRDVLAEAAAGPEHIVRMTWYITDKQAYLSSLKALGAAYREVMGKNFPPMSVVQVVALMEDEAKVEIEVTALK
jgi:enamine deaminase RidA (YjgF/YER057c/UK114 family)